MIKQIFYFLALSVLAISNQLFALDMPERLQIQEMLEKRLLPVVRSFDRDATVVVNLEEKKASPSVLESNPFVFQSHGIAPVESYQFSKFQVVILSRAKEVPDSAEALIKKLTRDVNVAPQITLENFPATGATEFTEPVPVKVELQGLEKTQAGLSSVSSLLFAAMGLIVFVFCVLGTVLFVATKQPNKASESEEHVKNAESHSPKMAERSEEKLTGYSDEALLAVLSDCYWCEEDKYAAFVWKHIPVEQRKNVLTGNTFLKNYVESLMGKSEENLGSLDHPYYFSPLSINHLDNKALTDLIRKHPVLLNRLSPLRLKHVHLSAMDRIYLEKEALSKTSAPDPVRMPSAKERALPNLSLIPLRSIDEEEIVGQQKALPLELKSRIPTLAWLCEVADGRRAEILNSFSEEELASAWIGPDFVLETLSKSLTLARRDALMALLSQIRPHRESSCFKKLHYLAIEALKAEANQGNVRHSKKAA